MAGMQTPAMEGGRCGLTDPDKIKPHPAISPTILQAIRHSEDGETALAAALRAARKARWERRGRHSEETQ
jgi:hypothetical protein